ncbi:serine carboxypeptidase [Mycena rosella]|uniref:Carboxypeptidase n=1 Tax=Mycena rosella TaxID=1033263 RepID=A0AAD7GH36_MYCRO|nr:serine carboxypeptidase [Mycena rosella]
MAPRILALVASLLGASFLLPAYASQTVLSSPGPGGAQAFAPAGTLEILSEASFTPLAHPEFPQYGVRIKKSRFCDETVNAYTGYIDIQARHLFFYFFESRSNPDKDDVIFWTNGGPGCSSGMGLFMELGPCRVANADNGTVFHQESWNSNANIFFIDQPIGVGFSYAEYGETVVRAACLILVHFNLEFSQSTTEEAAKDIAAFVAIFFAHFSKFQGRGFHMAGESYAGRYLPVFAAAVYDQNPRLVKAGLTPINLTSVIIGNGMTDIPTLLPSWYEMQCSTASVPPVQDIQTCVQMKARLPRCTKWFKESCQDQFDLINCEAADSFCTATLMEPYFAAGFNPYDITKKCGSSAMCYDEIVEIAKYLNQKDVQALLGVDVSTYASCSDKVGLDFNLNLDPAKGATEYVGALLERGVRVLIYVGTYDWACNWVGNEAWTLALEWSGQAAFSVLPLREWTFDGKRAGKTRAAGALTFATVDAAGHMVPYDKPKESLEMINRWIMGKDL